MSDAIHLLLYVYVGYLKQDEVADKAPHLILILVGGKRQKGDGRWEMGDGSWEMGDGGSCVL